MKAGRTANATRTDRRWCIPPAILRSPGETLDGIGILDELDEELGLLLWYAMRGVMLWGSTPARERYRLFGVCSTVPLQPAAIANLPEALRPSIESIMELRTVPPDRSDAELLALACLEVAAWARGSGHPRTALCFAQAGALAAPEFSEAALQTATCAIDTGDYVRSETWLRRAIAIARQEPNGAVYAASYTALGNLYRELGKPVRAERYLMRGLRTAWRATPRIPLAQRDAAYGLFRMALDLGDRAAAARWAGLALSGYRKGQPHAAPVLLDLARFWSDAGELDRAGAALRRLALHLGELSPAATVAAAALLARALAQAQPRRSKAAERRAWPLLSDDSVPDEAAFAAALDLAHAASLRKDRDALDRAARRAVRLAPPARYDQTRDTIAALGRDLPPPPPGPAARMRAAGVSAARKVRRSS